MDGLGRDAPATFKADVGGGGVEAGALAGGAGDEFGVIHALDGAVGIEFGFEDGIEA